MASFLESLGTALKVAGTGMSPQAAQNFQRQTELDQSRQMEVQKLTLGLLTTAAANGQPGADQLLAQYAQKMGLPTPEGFQGIGPSPQTRKFLLEQEQTEAHKRNVQLGQQQIRNIYVDPNISEAEKPLRAAEILGTLGLKDRADIYTDIAKARAEGKPSKPILKEIAVGTDPKTGKPLFQLHRLNIAEDGTMSVTPVPGDKPHVKGAVAEVTTNVFPGMTPEAAAKTELVAQGLLDMDQYRTLLYGEDGTVNRSLVAQMNVPFTKGLPFTDSRRAYSYMFNSVEAKLRAESGAAVPQPEVVRIMDRFYPSIWDNDETIRDKERRLTAFLEGTYRRIKGAHEIVSADGTVYKYNATGNPVKVNPPEEYTPPSRRRGAQGEPEISGIGNQQGAVDVEEIPRIYTLEEWEALPKGASYIDPQGVQRTKNGRQ